eukprot:352231-Chlamydomonas_euryale.AAC.10
MAVSVCKRRLAGSEMRTSMQGGTCCIQHRSTRRSALRTVQPPRAVPGLTMKELSYRAQSEDTGAMPFDTPKRSH